MIGHPINESGTKGPMIEFSDADIRATEVCNSSKTVAELKRQNDLYMQEIKGTKRRGIATLIISGASLLVSITSLICQILNSQQVIP